MISPTSALALMGLTCIAWAIVLTLRPSEGMGLPLLAVGVFSFLYVLQPAYLFRIGTLEIFLTDSEIRLGALVPALMLSAFMAGWLRRVKHLSVDGGVRPRPSAAVKWGDAQSHLTFWAFGAGSSLAGLMLYAVFVSRSGGVAQTYGGFHGSGAAWAENTAYLYLAPWWVLMGVSMMIVSAERARLPRWRLGVPLVFSAILVGHALLLASRGMTFSICSVCLLSFGLARRSRVSAPKALPFLAGAGILVLLVLGFRSILYLADDKPDAVPLDQALTAALDVNDQGIKQRTTGVEFILHAAALDTVNKTRKYDGGLNWLYVFTLHPIPRVLWPDKPYSFDFPMISWEDIYEVTGLAVASGAAAGVVGDVYEHFFLFSPVIFYICGRLSRKAYEAAYESKSPSPVCVYVLLYALGLNALAQGIGAILVPYPYALLPLLIFRLSQALRLNSAGRLLPSFRPTEARAER